MASDAVVISTAAMAVHQSQEEQVAQDGCAHQYGGIGAERMHKQEPGQYGEHTIAKDLACEKDCPIAQHHPAHEQ